MAKIKISEYAKIMGISHKTAWRWVRSGMISGKVIGPRNIFIHFEESPQMAPQPSPLSSTSPSVFIYCRVSTRRDQETLDRPIERVKDYGRGKGYPISQVVAEVARGMNDNRAKLISLLKNPKAKLIVMEHKDRLTRLGFNTIAELLKMQNRPIEVVDLSDHPQDDLLPDLVCVIPSFCARLYGPRRGGQISKKTIEFLKQQENKE